MSETTFDLLSIGEMMLRRIDDREVLGGASVNLAAGLARCYGWPLGATERLRVGMLSAVVDDTLGQSMIEKAQAYGGDTSFVAAVANDGAGKLVNVLYSLTPSYGERVPPRAGYFYRAHSPMAKTVPQHTDWSTVFENSKIAAIFSDGICLGIDRFKEGERGTREFLQEGFSLAASYNCAVCFDTNFRMSLWADRGGLQGAAAAYRELLPFVEVLTGSIGQFRALLEREDSDPAAFAGSCIDRPEIARELIEALIERYPNLKVVGASMRQELSPAQHRWRCALSRNATFTTSRTYDMRVVDRPGIGDAMALQIVAGSLMPVTESQTVVERAAAHGWLMSQVACDVSPFSLSEIDGVWQNESIVTSR